MAKRLLFKINELTSEDFTKVGSKAYRLGELSRAGFHVPEGVVIPAEICLSLQKSAYQQWPKFVVQAIQTELEPLVQKYHKVAVRSSALAEDSDELSYAGQFQTVLNVKNLTQCLCAIATVIASSEAEHIAIYQQHLSQNQTPHGIAVIIQAMASGDFSGVIFSQNLITERESEILIEAVSGDVDAVVSGTTLSEQVSIDRKTFQIKKHTKHAKKMLDSMDAKKLAQFAIEVEKIFQQPCDIEYLYHPEKITILQARPITTTRRQAAQDKDEFRPPEDKNVIWTCHNVQEAFPKVMVPFSMSIWQHFINPALNRHHNKLRIKSKTEITWLFGFFYGRVHANVSLSRRMTDRILGQDPDTVMRAYLGKVLPYPDREPALKRWFYRIYSAPFTNYYSLRLPIIVKKLNQKIIKHWLWLQKEDLATYSNQALIKLLADLMNNIGGNSVGYHITVFTLPTFAVNLLHRILQPILFDKTQTIINQLLSGLTQVESALISEDIWQLSRIAKKHALTLNESFNPLNHDLPNEWLNTYQKFIDHHGHRGLHELVYEAPLWRDDSISLIKMIRQQIDLDESHSPLLSNQKAKNKRVKLTDEILAQCNFWQRLLIKMILSKAQQWTALREFSKSTEAKGLRIIDPILQEMIERLLKKKCLRDRVDFWYLTCEEINNLLLAEQPDDISALVVQRQKTMAVNQFIHLPEYFYGYPNPIKPKTIDVGVTTMRGVAVNSGVVKGKARLITRFSDADKLQPGEILVTHISDAAWTPLFTLAAGIVVDIGSLLSHSSIIAREFGLPAVINVQIATRIIKTGDIITVDGDQGLVSIESGR